MLNSLFKLFEHKCVLEVCFTRIIHDPALSTEELSIRVFL